MSAREEAQKAVHLALLPTPLGTYKDTLYRSRAADAVSDVWEPIVRNLLLDIRFCGETAKISSLTGQEGFKQALKALGVEDLSRIN